MNPLSRSEPSCFRNDSGFLYFACKYMVPERNIPNPLVARYPHLLLLTTNFLIYLLMNLSDQNEYLFKTAKYINPPLSVVFLLQPKGGLSVSVRNDQKLGTKKPDLLSQIRRKMAPCAGFDTRIGGVKPSKYRLCIAKRQKECYNTLENRILGAYRCLRVMRK